MKLVVLVLALAGVLLAQQNKPAEKDLRLRFTNLTARTVAAVEALRTMDVRLKRQGSSVRSDIVAARVSLEAFMDDAEEALEASRWSGASKAMDNATQSVSKIEAFLQGK